jgi:hypothetical protein
MPYLNDGCQSATPLVGPTRARKLRSPCAPIPRLRRPQVGPATNAAWPRVRMPRFVPAVSLLNPRCVDGGGWVDILVGFRNRPNLGLAT